MMVELLRHRKYEFAFTKKVSAVLLLEDGIAV